MARSPRVDVGEHVYHVINRANNKATLFKKVEDYVDFEYLLNEVRETFDMRILAYIIMPNHWHLLLYPRHDGDLGRSMHWLATSHVRRHHSRYQTIGHGHLYQGTYKSFLVQTDPHFLTVLKYIERNAVRAKLSKTTELWRWGSAYRRINGTAKQKLLLAECPVTLPRNYVRWLNDPEPSEVLDELRKCVNTSQTHGLVDIGN